MRILDCITTCPPQISRLCCTPALYAINKEPNTYHNALGPRQRICSRSKKCNLLRWSKLNLCLFLLIFRQKQDEVMKLESQIRTKAEEQRKSGQELDSTCQICLKTKFADGIGHLCNYCNVRCCARCGGKVALRSSKVCYLQKFR